MNRKNLKHAVMIVVITAFCLLSSCGFQWDRTLTYRITSSGGTGEIEITYTDTFGSQIQISRLISGNDEWLMSIQPSSGRTFTLKAVTPILINMAILLNGTEVSLHAGGPGTISANYTVP